MPIKLNTASGGGVILTGANTASDKTITVPAVDGTMQLIQQGTAVASTSGTSIDFTSIPSWAKRITVMFSGVSTNGTSAIQVQLGDAGGVETTGYASSTWTANTNNANFTSGFAIRTSNVATILNSGHVILTLVGSNTWVASGVMGRTDAADTSVYGGNKTLSDTLDRIRITTVNGTDTFDAGTINIMWEG